MGDPQVASPAKPAIPSEEPRSSPQLDPEGLLTQVQLLLSTLDVEERLSTLARKTPASAPPRSTPEGGRDLRWYLIGLGCVGAAIGMFAGLSQTPVVGILLPTLFGIIGTGGGYYLSSREMEPKRARLLGYGLVTFIVPTIVMALLGISMRTQTGILSMRPRLWTQAPKDNSISITKAGDRNAAYMYRLAKLRANLVSLGSSPEEIRRILTEATNLLSDPSKAQFGATSAITSMTKLVSLLKSKPSGTGAQSDSVESNVIIAKTEAFALELSRWKQLSLLYASENDLTSRIDEMITWFDCSLGQWKTLSAECQEVRGMLLSEKQFLRQLALPLHELFPVTDTNPAPRTVRDPAAVPVSGMANDVDGPPQ